MGFVTLAIHQSRRLYTATALRQTNVVMGLIIGGGVMALSALLGLFSLPYEWRAAGS